MTTHLQFQQPTNIPFLIMGKPATTLDYSQNLLKQVIPLTRSTSSHSSLSETTHQSRFNRVSEQSKNHLQTTRAKVSLNLLEKVKPLALDRIQITPAEVAAALAKYRLNPHYKGSRLNPTSQSNNTFVSTHKLNASGIQQSEPEKDYDLCCFTEGNQDPNAVIKQAKKAILELVQQKLVAQLPQNDAIDPELLDSLNSGGLRYFYIRFSRPITGSPQPNDFWSLIELGPIDIAVGRFTRPYRFAHELSATVNREGLPDQLKACEGSLNEALTLQRFQRLHSTQFDTLHQDMLPNYYKLRTQGWTASVELSRALFKALEAASQGEPQTGQTESLPARFTAKLTSTLLDPSIRTLSPAMITSFAMDAFTYMRSPVLRDELVQHLSSLLQTLDAENTHLQQNVFSLLSDTNNDAAITLLKSNFQQNPLNQLIQSMGQEHFFIYNKEGELLVTFSEPVALIPSVPRLPLSTPITPSTSLPTPAHLLQENSARIEATKTSEPASPQTPLQSSPLPLTLFEDKQELDDSQELEEIQTSEAPPVEQITLIKRVHSSTASLTLSSSEISLAKSESSVEQTEHLVDQHAHLRTEPQTLTASTHPITHTIETIPEIEKPAEITPEPKAAKSEDNTALKVTTKTERAEPEKKVEPQKQAEPQKIEEVSIKARKRKKSKLTQIKQLQDNVGDNSIHQKRSKKKGQTKRSHKKGQTALEKAANQRPTPSTRSDHKRTVDSDDDRLLDAIISRNEMRNHFQQTHRIKKAVLCFIGVLASNEIYARFSGKTDQYSMLKNFHFNHHPTQTHEELIESIQSKWPTEPWGDLLGGSPPSVSKIADLQYAYVDFSEHEKSAMITPTEPGKHPKKPLDLGQLHTISKTLDVQNHLMHNLPDQYVAGMKMIAPVVFGFQPATYIAIQTVSQQNYLFNLVHTLNQHSETQFRIESYSDLSSVIVYEPISARERLMNVFKDRDAVYRHLAASDDFRFSTLAPKLDSLNQFLVLQVIIGQSLRNAESSLIEFTQTLTKGRQIVMLPTQLQEHGVNYDELFAFCKELTGDFHEYSVELEGEITKLSELFRTDSAYPSISTALLIPGTTANRVIWPSIEKVARAAHNPTKHTFKFEKWVAVIKQWALSAQHNTFPYTADFSPEKSPKAQPYCHYSECLQQKKGISAWNIPLPITGPSN